MPGHKRGKWDITELSYSDNLSSPKGCIAQAESEIAEILGAEKSFILTDGSTSGVLSMLWAAKLLGARTVAVLEKSHKSVFNGCKVAGLTPLVYSLEPPFTLERIKESLSELLSFADALFITSPDYYGRVADLQALRDYCDKENKLLLIDGAHGGHLHFDKKLYAGSYADMWVDGVHKSLPALTQGAVVSARNEVFADALWKALDIFRTTSPSYPVMASVEYAVKYPRNPRLEREAKAFMQTEGVDFADDWTKICVRFGENAFAANAELEKMGIYAELCDGEVVEFYLSPATKLRDFNELKKRLLALREKYPYIEQKSVQRVPAPLLFNANGKTAWVELEGAEGRICAAACGLFPPCTPLISRGERIEKEKIERLQAASNVFGLKDGKILVYEEEEK